MIHSTDLKTVTERHWRQSQVNPGLLPWGTEKYRKVSRRVSSPCLCSKWVICFLPNICLPCSEDLQHPTVSQGNLFWGFISLNTKKMFLILIYIFPDGVRTRFFSEPSWPLSNKNPFLSTAVFQILEDFHHRFDVVFRQTVQLSLFPWRLYVFRLLIIIALFLLSSWKCDA